MSYTIKKEGPVTIIDDFLEPNDFAYTRDYFMGKEIPSPVPGEAPYSQQMIRWDWVGSVVAADELNLKDALDNYQLVNMLWDTTGPTPGAAFIASTLSHPLINVAAVVKIKANLNPRTKNILIHGFHSDVPFDCMTAILYINTNDGYTIFDNGYKVESVENRLLTFPSQLKHSGTTCTNAKRRIVINFNYFTATLGGKELNKAEDSTNTGFRTVQDLGYSNL